MNIELKNHSGKFGETLSASVSHLTLIDLYRNMVDSALYFNTGTGYEYVSQTLKHLSGIPGTLENHQIAFQKIITEIRTLNIFACKKLIGEIDDILESPFYNYNDSERRSFMYVRNIIFTRHENLIQNLRDPKR